MTARLARRLRALGLPDFEAYVQYLDRDLEGAELSELVDALTTNKTSFFREPSQFEFLRARLLPDLASSEHPPRFWSAGCSTGEEPYSLAIALREWLPGVDARDPQVLATDVSRQVLETARRAQYDDETLRDVEPALVARYFHRPPGVPRGVHAVNESVRRLVRIARLNLVDDWPMSGPFDAIFCRNVMIYFDNPVRERTVARFWRMLRPGGYLFVGGSESLSAIAHPFRYVQPAVFVKPPELSP